MGRRRVTELRRPRTKAAIDPFRLPTGEILFDRDVLGLGLSVADDPGGTIWKLLRLMNGVRDIRALGAGLRRAGAAVSDDALRKAIDHLHRLGIVEEGDDRWAEEFTPSEIARYRPNRDFFSLVTLGSPLAAREVQARLRAARVTILGVGAIGGATAYSLVAAGVGRIRLFDHDRVELSNLNRQMLYVTADVGRRKVEAAVARLRKVNPLVRVTGRALRVRGPRDLPALLRGCDLFILAADQPHTILYWANDAAEAARVPWLENSYGGPRMATALFVPGKTPCLRCQQEYLRRRQRSRAMDRGQALFRRSAANPVIAPTAGIAGHYGALQALYFLGGLKAPAMGRLVHQNLWDPRDVQVLRPPHWAACPTCGRPRPRRHPQRAD